MLTYLCTNYYFICTAKSETSYPAIIGGIVAVLAIAIGSIIIIVVIWILVRRSELTTYFNVHDIMYCKICVASTLL